MKASSQLDEIMREICRTEPLAYQWFCQAWELHILWDHVIDGDAVDKDRAHRAFQAVSMDWILNDWYHKNRLCLVPVISNLSAAWRVDPADTSRASLDPMIHLPATIALLLLGHAGVEKWMPRIKAVAELIRFTDLREDHSPFFIVGLPRSRTAWFSAFLSGGDVTCHHELLRKCARPEEFAWKLAETPTPIVGDADSILPAAYYRIKESLPKHKLVFIVRNPEDALKATLAAAPEHSERITARWPKIVGSFQTMLANETGLIEQFSDLDNESTCRRISEYCTGLPFDPIRWASFSELKITMDFAKAAKTERMSSWHTQL